MRTLALVPDAQPAAAPAGPLVEVVVPVHNEQHVLEASIWRLHGYLEASFPFSFRITIADNASTDATWLLAKRLAERLGGVRAVHVPEKGRGRALRQVWAPATPPWSPTWTSTCPPAWRRCCRWSRPCCRATATWPSAPAWPTAPPWSGGRGGSSSRAATTCCCAPPCGPASATPSAASRRAGPRSCGRCSRPSRTRPGSSTPSCCWPPSAAACASTRSRSTGSRTPTAGSTWSGPPWTTCAAWPGWPASGSRRRLTRP